MCTVPPFRVPIRASLSVLALALIYIPPPLIPSLLGLRLTGAPGPTRLVGRVVRTRNARDPVAAVRPDDLLPVLLSLVTNFLVNSLA